MTAQNLIARLGDGDRAGTHPRGCDGLHITCARDNAANGDARWADSHHDSFSKRISSLAQQPEPL